MADPLTRQRRIRRARKELAVWQERREIEARLRGGPPGDPSFWQHFQSAVGGGDLRQPYAEHPGIYRAVSVIVQDMGGVPWQVMTGTEQKPRPVESGPWYDLLNDPHPELDMAEVWDLTRVWRLTDGEAFWILYGSDGRPVQPREMPAAIEPCRGSGWREILSDRNGMLVGWEYTPGGSAAPVRLLADQVVHFKLPNPYNRRRGLAPLHPLLRSIRTDEKARGWNEASLDHGAEPSLAIEQQPGTGGMFAPLDDTQRKQLEQTFRDRYAGWQNKGKPILLEAGFKVSPFGWTPKDMEYGDQRKWSRYEIASAYGVPLMLMGDMSEIHSKESARVQMRTYWQQTILGHFGDEVRVLDRQLFLGRGDVGNTPTMQRVWSEPDFSGVEYLREEEAVRRSNAEADRRLGFPLNEINEQHKLGYPEQDAGDIGLVSGGLIPVTAAAIDFGPGRSAARTRRRIKIASLDESERAVLWHQYIRGIQRPGEVRMRGKLVGWMKDVRRDALKFIEKDGRSFSSRKLLEKDVTAWIDEQREKWAASLLRSTDPVTKWIVEQSLDRLAGQIGADPLNVTNPAVAEHLDAMGARKVTFINGRIEGLLRRTLIEGVGSNENVADLAQRVKAVMNASASRSLMIARTESGAASTGARFAAYGEQGVSRHSWLSSRDEDVREEHQIDGEVVDVGARFSNTLHYPLDSAASDAGLVVNCYLPGTRVAGRFVGGSKTRYAGPVWTIETARGNRLSVTPNHPILTGRGWIPAHGVREGDHLLRRVGGDRDGSINRCVDNQDGPAPIEQVFHALSAHASIGLIEVSTLDFHGDGEFGNGDIQVVGSYRMLERGRVSRRFEPIGERDLASSDMGLAEMAGVRSAALFGEGLFAPTGGAPGRSALTFDRFPSPLPDVGPFEPLRFGTSPNLDALLDEAGRQRGSLYSRLSGQAEDGFPIRVSRRKLVKSVDLVTATGSGKLPRFGASSNLGTAFPETRAERLVAHPDTLRDLNRRFSGLVSADQVVKVRKRDAWAGHVYDLQEKSGVMVADGLIQSNCRCDTLPED